MSAVPFSPRRVLLIAQNTLQAALRQRLFLGVGLLALGIVGGAAWLRDFSFGVGELKFVADCGLGAMTFFGAALVVTATAESFLGEIEHRTAHTLLAKPVWRGEFVLGKFLGVAAMTAIFCAAITGVLCGILGARAAEMARELPGAIGAGGVDYGNVLTAGFLQWLKLTVLGAFVLLVATLAESQLLTVLLGFFILIICHLQSLADDAYARAGSVAGRAFARGVALVFPNFQLFAVSEAVGTAERVPWADVVRVGGYGGVYIVAACALAIFSFSRREI